MKITVSAVTLTLALGAAGVGPAMAQSKTWLFSDFNCTGAMPNDGNCDGYSDSRTFVEDGQGTGENTYNGTGALVTLEGWANTADKSGGIDNALEQGEILGWSNATGSYGIRNADHGGGGDATEGDNPEHAVDNDQRYDMMLLDFGGDEWVLTDVATSWSYNDADLTVLYYDGSVGGAPASGDGSELVDDLTFSELLSSGWEVLGHYGVSTPTDPTTSYVGNYDIQDGTDPNRKSSSYWLVGTYVDASLLPGSCFTPTGASSTECNVSDVDHVKLSSVTGTTSPTSPTSPTTLPGTTDVPEPSTLWLLAAGVPLLLRRWR